MQSYQGLTLQIGLKAELSALMINGVNSPSGPNFSQILAIAGALGAGENLEGLT